MKKLDGLTDIQEPVLAESDERHTKLLAEYKENEKRVNKLRQSVEKLYLSKPPVQNQLGAFEINRIADALTNGQPIEGQQKQFIGLLAGLKSEGYKFDNYHIQQAIKDFFKEDPSKVSSLIAEAPCDLPEDTMWGVFRIMLLPKITKEFPELKQVDTAAKFEEWYKKTWSRDQDIALINWSHTVSEDKYKIPDDFTRGLKIYRYFYERNVLALAKRQQDTGVVSHIAALLDSKAQEKMDISALSKKRKASPSEWSFQDLLKTTLAQAKKLDHPKMSEVLAINIEYQKNSSLTSEQFSKLQSLAVEIRKDFTASTSSLSPSPLPSV